MEGGTNKEKQRRGAFVATDDAYKNDEAAFAESISNRI